LCPALALLLPLLLLLLLLQSTLLLQLLIALLLRLRLAAPPGPCPEPPTRGAEDVEFVARRTRAPNGPGPGEGEDDGELDRTGTGPPPIFPEIFEILEIFEGPDLEVGAEVAGGRLLLLLGSGPTVRLGELGCSVERSIAS